MKYLSTFEIAEKWGISPRRVGWSDTLKPYTQVI